MLPRETPPGAPVFDEAWHAEALGLANVLVASGLFSAAEWADALGAALREAAARDAPDDQDTYYRAVVAAVEGLVAAHSPDTGSALSGRIEAWRRAYLATPHGKPVELAAGLRET
jgi:nitrile hydratase accessory protein